MATIHANKRFETVAACESKAASALSVCRKQSPRANALYLRRADHPSLLPIVGVDVKIAC